MFVPSGQAPTSANETLSTTQLYHDDFTQLIFPFTNFTCSSNITKLMFIARLQGRSCSVMETLSGFDTWPQFYLWHHHNYGSDDGHYFNRIRSIGPSRPNQLVCSRILNTLNSDYQIGLIEMNLAEPIGPLDILGLQQQRRDSVTPTPAQESTVTFRESTVMFEDMQQSASVSVLIQTRGYGLTFSCVPYSTNHECYSYEQHSQQMPYIALEIGSLF